MMKYKNKAHGFTLVELLIVIVVIAILAVITLVTYNGIQSRASDSLVKSDLLSNSKRLQYYIVEHGEIPTGPQTAGTDPGVVSYRFELSKRKSYRWFNFHTARINTGDRYTSEALLVAESSSGNMFAYSITKTSVNQVTVTDEIDQLLRSDDGTDRRTGATLLLQYARQIAESRGIIRNTGAVEWGFVIIKG